MRTFLIDNQLLVNQYPNARLFKTKHIGGTLFKVMTAQTIDVKVVKREYVLGYQDFLELTVTDAQFDKIESMLNRVRIDRIEIIK